MYCPTCGSQNENESVQFCSRCGTDLTPDQQYHGYDRNQLIVPNHLVWAILTTIFCCLPFGIVAIIYAAQVNDHLDAENYDQAKEASGKAKIWCCWSFGLGAFGAFICGIVLVSST